MSEHKTYAATIPASCVQALVAWKGEFEAAPILIEPHPTKRGVVNLLASDGHSILCLNVSGECSRSFAFDMPRELAELCQRKPPMKMYLEGEDVPISCSPWYQPWEVFIYRLPVEGKSADVVHALVMGMEPHPDCEEAALGRATGRFVEGWPKVIRQFASDHAPGEQTTSKLIKNPLPSGALPKLHLAVAAIKESDAVCDVGFEVTENTKDRYHLWRFHHERGVSDSWALSMFMKPEVFPGKPKTRSPDRSEAPEK